MNRVLAFLVLLVLAACGDIPQPFRHEGLNPTLMPKASRGLAVPPLDDTPAARRLAEVIVRRLLEAEIPASVRPLVPGAWTIRVAVQPEPGLAVFTWQLEDGGGGALASLEQRVPAATWERASERSLEKMAAEVVETFLVPLSGTDAAALAESRPDPARVPTFRLIAPAGLPGDGDKALAIAMTRLLTAAGMASVGEGAVFQIKGQATVSPGKTGEELLAVAWTVLGKEGESLGTAQQQGPVPKGRLSGAWGSLAGDVAAGGAEGVLEIIRATLGK